MKNDLTQFGVATLWNNISQHAAEYSTVTLHYTTTHIED